MGREAYEGGNFERWREHIEWTKIRKQAGSFGTVTHVDISFDNLVVVCVGDRNPVDFCGCVRHAYYCCFI
jgi:hypothetical protein